MAATSTYGKAIKDILTSLSTKAVGTFEDSFLKDNDFFSQFLACQQNLYLSLSEEMKTKVVQSVQSTCQIISQSSREGLEGCRKETAEMESLFGEREKLAKK